MKTVIFSDLQKYFRNLVNKTSEFANACFYNSDFISASLSEIKITNSKDLIEFIVSNLFESKEKELMR